MGGEVERALAVSRRQLEELNLFKKVEVDCKIDEHGFVDTVFVFEERGRAMSVNGNVDKRGEMSFDVKVEQPALFGGPLSVAGLVTSSVNQAHNFMLRFSTPRLCGRPYAGNFEAGRSTTDETQASGYRERVLNAVMKFSSGPHTLSLEAALRDLDPSGKRLPCVELQKGPLCSAKTSVKYKVSLARVFPYFARVQCHGAAELAGFAGDASFLRGDGHVGADFLLPWNMRGTFAGTCGLLFPFTRPSYPQDRFFLGGASGPDISFKGFAYRGLGPVGHCDGGHVGESNKKRERTTDALGGEVMVNGYAALSKPLPLPDGFPGAGIIRGFGFLQVGSLVDKSNVPMLENILSQRRASIGAGVSIPLGAGSLEFTLAHPWGPWVQPDDLLDRRQLGIRFDFQG